MTCLKVIRICKSSFPLYVPLKGILLFDPDLDDALVSPAFGYTIDGTNTKYGNPRKAFRVMIYNLKAPSKAYNSLYLTCIPDSAKIDHIHSVITHHHSCR